jgi:hypothetical protein
MEKKLLDADIISPKVKDNDTWNTCPECEISWKDRSPTPGVIHRVRLCSSCWRKIAKRAWWYHE